MLNIKNLIYKDNLYYEKESGELFTGEVNTGKTEYDRYIALRIEDGKVLSENYYLKDGKLRKKKIFIENENKWKIVYFFGDGLIEEIVHYVDGKANGPFVKYHNEKQLAEQGTYKNGFLIGEYVAYWYHGRLKEKAVYAGKDNEEEENLIVGNSKFYYRGGSSKEIIFEDVSYGVYRKERFYKPKAKNFSEKIYFLTTRYDKEKIRISKLGYKLERKLKIPLKRLHYILVLILVVVHICCQRKLMDVQKLYKKFLRGTFSLKDLEMLRFKFNYFDKIDFFDSYKIEIFDLDLLKESKNVIITKEFSMDVLLNTERVNFNYNLHPIKFDKDSYFRHTVLHEEKVKESDLTKKINYFLLFNEKFLN